MINAVALEKAVDSLLRSRRISEAVRGRPPLRAKAFSLSGPQFAGKTSVFLQISRDMAEVVVKGRSFAEHIVPLFLHPTGDNLAAIAQVALAMKVQLEDLTDSLLDLRQELPEWAEFSSELEGMNGQCGCVSSAAGNLHTLSGSPHPYHFDLLFLRIRRWAFVMPSRKMLPSSGMFA